MRAVQGEARRTERARAAKAGRVQTENLQRKDTDTIEISWEVPVEPVDAFILRYGENPTALDRSERLNPARLVVVKNSDGVLTYTHSVQGVPHDSTLYFSLAAEKAGVVSEPSPPFEVTSSQMQGVTEN